MVGAVDGAVNGVSIAAKATPAIQRTKRAALMAQSKRFHNSHIQHPMHILISNDDGYFAPGLICLAEHLARIADVVVVAVLGLLVAAVVTFAQHWRAPFVRAEPIDLSLTALPRYTTLSLVRGLVAYLLSLLVTLVYGTAAAHSARAARALIPLLDVLQSIPVLGFLPGLVLGLVALFPTNNVGLELACVVMIFTGQAWNMIFSFYSSLRALPRELGEAASVYRLSPWQRFRTLEVPAATIGLVWNSMMSMAGGWFFLSVAEAFTLGEHDFRLPGLGAYMSVAIDRADYRAMAAGVGAMTVMIIATDVLLWRPLSVWAERFKLEDTAGVRSPQSWVLSVATRSRILRLLARLGAWRPSLPRVAEIVPWPRLAWAGGSILALVLAGAALAGTVALGRLLFAVPLLGWERVGVALAWTFVRVSCAVGLAALWTVPVGIIVGRSTSLTRRLAPVIQLLASFPAPMLYPLVTLALIALHVPFSVAAAVLMFLGAQWYVLFNVIAGASAIPAELSEAADMLRLRGGRRWSVLELPVVFPYLVTGLITAAGGAWNASIVAEVVRVAGHSYVAPGLGSLITGATAEGDFPLLTAGVLSMALSVVGLNRMGWRRLYRLAETRYALGR